MSKKLLIAVLILGAPLAFAGPDAEYDKIDLVVPIGDPEAGRTAYIELSCTTCHAVAGDAELAKPVASVPVPKLTSEHARMSPGKLATAIVAPSHSVDKEVARKTEGKLSPMADFSEAMTVRQLVDLVAYIRSIDD